MAGLKLKSGADFCNFEAFRMRLHNDGEDPTSDFGVGQIYFNTSDTSVGSARHVRLYDGTKFRSLAYLDEIAKNEAFLALKERVDLLSGDVDTDAIISNMKEVSAFLEGFAEDASLMDLLNGKLDKTGGTISGNLTLEAYLRFNRLNDGKSYLLGQPYDNSTLAFYDGSAWRDIITSAGGTIDGSILIGKNDNTAYKFLRITRSGKVLELTTTGSKGQLMYNGVGFSFNETQASWNDNTLLHSGNVGEYKAGSADVIAKTYANESINYANNESKIRLIRGTASNSADLGFPRQFTSGISVVSTYAGWQMVCYGSNSVPNPYYRAVTDEGVWGFWKQLAFLDDNVASAQALQTSGGVKFAEFAESTVYIGSETYQNYNTSILGKTVRLYSGNASLGLILNSSGNVTIGDQDLAGTDAKLYVDGHIKLGASGYLYKNDKTIIDFAGDAPLFGYGTAAAGLGTKVYGSDIRLYYGGTTNVGFILNSSGNVTIGAEDKAGTDARLHIEDTRESSSYLLNARFLSPNLLAGGTSAIIFGKSESTNNRAYIGYTHHSDGSDSNAITFGFYGKDKIVNFLANGNILIGTTNDNGAELQVAGSSTILGALSASTSFDLNRNGDNGNIFNSERAAFEIETLAKTVRFRTFNPNVNNVLTFYGSQGNVGIGKIAYTHKLEVEGNVHISGSLIVDGEVSAGGAGTEGGNAGGGGGAFHSESIGVGATQTTIAHGLGTDDIVVSIYEKDGVSGRWSIILTDVEIVDANNIIVSFGSATTVEHKVVIMGAVA